MDKAGGATTTQKGCESRSLLKHVQNKAIDEEFKNNTEWHYSKPLYDSPRCNEIITAAGLNEENQFSQNDIRVCLDIEFVENDNPSKGKICCCKGKNNCNGNDLLWSEIAITMKDIEKFREKHSNNENLLNSSAAETKTIETFFSHVFSIFILFFALF
uniref:Uncharacterized protein n=1 Tax=Panagrolaimus davidi TaxID=227884 RepID=A0A914PZ16_9BILA